MNKKRQVNGPATRLGRTVGLLAVVILTAAIGLLLFGSPLGAAPGIIYVKADATSANNGTSWADAYTDLQTALTAANSGDEIWVAAGTYKPTTGTDRTATFQLKNDVALYGGFAGGETVRDQRDWETNVTILSGDIGTVGDNSDNSYHVVTGSGTDDTAVLDGFTVTGGNADGYHACYYGAGGMYNDKGSPTVTNCTFSSNSATYRGGGMFNWYSSPTVTNCTFSDNSAHIYFAEGGGMANRSSNPTVTNCTFSDNSAYFGGGMYNAWSNPMLTHCTFSGNSATSGGGMSNWSDSSPILTNCTFSNNSTTYQGGGMYNSQSSPTLANVTFSDNSANQGGGMYNSFSDPMVVNCTFSGNSAAWWEQGDDTDDLTIYALASHPGSPNVYAGVWGDGVYRAVSGENSWWQTPLGFPMEVSSLVIDPASPSIVYAGTRGDGIKRSANGGDSWGAVTGLEGQDVWSLTITSTVASIYAYAGTAGEIYTSTNGIDWDLAGGAEIGTEKLYSLAIDPEDSRTAYVGTLNKGIYRTTDGGLNWTPRGLDGKTVRALAIHPSDSEIIYAGTQSHGIFKSTDGGISWPLSGLDGHNVLAIAINPRNPEFVYAGTYGDGVWASYDSGHSWHRMPGLTGGASFVYSLTLFIPEGEDDCQVLYAGTTDGVWARTVTLLGSSLTLANCSLGGNYGGGIYNGGNSNPTLRNTIVANSALGGDCSGDGTITSEGYNLDSDGTCGFTGEGDLSNTDPLLGPLQDNGGPTFTHALLAGSPAIDGGNPAGCTDPWGNPLTTDQRGEMRPADGDCDGVPICDIGAYEVSDSDCDGLTDAQEDAYCTDKNNPDTDGDGLYDGNNGVNPAEDTNNNATVDAGETDPCDRDTDDDGLEDGNTDLNGDGLTEGAQGTSATNADTDGDGTQDGTESGITTPVADPDGAGPLKGTDPNVFVPDADPTTTTDPLDDDTDDDGLKDGSASSEDMNDNGRVDAGETDPNNPDTDGDGWDDGTEVRRETDPLDPDDHPLPIGGIIVPVNTLELLAPWICLTLLALATAILLVRRHTPGQG